ncbi:MAG TPA: GntR family transcriptional regulator [Terriglobales bacterium]|nr:GntR family transcriptional regulator [Terriglobales bacterium]
MTTSERLYRSLKQDITTCVLRPGAPFSESEICRRYKGSRTPVREACRHLEREGLINIVPFRGYFVAPLTLAEFHNLHEIQLIVDPAAAGLAALRAQPHQLKAMEGWAEYAYRVGVRSSYFTFLQRNFNLHVGIAQASHNQHLVEIVTSVQTRLMRFFYLIIAMDAYGPQLVNEHEEIVRAIRARRPEEARQRAADHVTNTIRRSAGLFMTSTETRLGELITDPGLMASFPPEGLVPGGIPERGDAAQFHDARASIAVDPSLTARKESSRRKSR